MILPLLTASQSDILPAISSETLLNTAAGLGDIIAAHTLMLGRGTLSSEKPASQAASARTLEGSHANTPARIGRDGGSALPERPVASQKELRGLRLRTATPSTVREVNRAIVLNLIRIHQPISRVELSERTGIHRSNVSDIVDGLLDKGLLVESRAVPRGRGRVPIMLSLNADKVRVVGVSIRAAQTEIALAGLTGQISYHVSFSTPQSPLKLVDRLSETIAEIRKTQLVHPTGSLDEIGISVPGLVCSTSGTIRRLPRLLDYSGFELAAELEKRTGIHTAVENDANLGALAQLWLSEREIAGLRDFVFLTITSVGVGAGIILNRELYGGHDSSYAGEFGHMIVDPEGPPCSCGRAGCLELYICDRATWHRYCPGTEFEVARFEDLIGAARQGDVRALAAFQETGRYLSVGMSNIFLALNPEAVVLAGRITRVWDSIRDTVEAGIQWLGFKASIRMTHVNPEQLYLNGAISLALSRAFAKPKVGW